MYFSRIKLSRLNTTASLTNPLYHRSRSSLCSKFTTTTRYPTIHHHHRLAIYKHTTNPVTSSRLTTLKEFKRTTMTTVAPSEFPPPALKQIANEVGQLLKDRKATVAVAETAAGGLISASLLSVPGASSYYLGGLTLYTLPSRTTFSHWTSTEIQSYNGPTPALVGGLADDVRKKLSAQYAIGESGTAGPTASGETPNRQPGYVALAVSGPGATSTKDVETGLGDRQENMLAFAVAALQFLKEVVVRDARL